MSSRRKDDYLQQVSDKKERVFDPFYDLSSYNHDAVKEQVEFLEGHGLNFVYILAPLASDFSFAYALKEEEILPPARSFFYDNPNIYPLFFDPKNRHDEGHLSEDASTSYTRTIAEDVLDFIPAFPRTAASNSYNHSPPSSGAPAGSPRSVSSSFKIARP